MDSLPPEIAFHIGKCCDFRSLVRLLSVNCKWNSVSKYLLLRTYEFDFKQNLNGISMDEKIEGLILFFYQNMANITHLKLNNPKIRLSCSDFILIARALPNLQILEIDQAEEPQISYDSLYSLCFFKELKQLSIKGWSQFNCAGRGSSYRTTLPYGHFLNLQRLQLHNTATILDFLMNIHSFTREMTNLRGIELIFTEDSDKSILLLMQFFASHSNLTSIILENLKFEQITGISSFLRSFVYMEKLKELQLKNFEFPTAMDPRIIRNFVNVMKTKGVLLEVL